MTKRILLCLALLLGVSGELCAQGVQRIGVVQNARGEAIPSAQIYVCSSTATVTLTATPPCTPELTIYSDVALTQPITQPATSSGNGNYVYYVGPQTVEECIAGPQINTFCQPVQLNSGGGGGSTPAAPGNAVQVGNSTVTGLATVTCNGAYFAIDSVTAPTLLTEPCNLNILGTQGNAGANPWIDTSIYGMRAVTSPPSTTASCSGGNILTFTSSTGFQVGDGVLVNGCGTSNALSTPSTPTITPSLISGPDVQSTDAVAAPSGGTTSYSYEVAAFDKFGGMTAATAAGSTSTGWTLGEETSTITTESRSNNTSTINTSAANGAATGALTYLLDSSDATFSGWYQVASAPSGTSLTFNQGMDTRAGATTSGTGGTANVYNCNNILIPYVSAVYQYGIWETSPSARFVGWTRPNDPPITISSVQYASFNDCGATISAAPTVPDYVPSTPPASATNDYLSTTITAIAGTSVTVATPASQTISGQNAHFDDAPAFEAAYNAASTTVGAGLRISTPPAGEGYFFYAHQVLNGSRYINIQQGGAITLNGTMEFPLRQPNWTGLTGSGSCLSPQFAMNCGQAIYITQAYPGFIVGAPAHFDYVTATIASQGLGIEINGNIGNANFNANIEHSNFVIGGTADYLGLAVLGLGISNSTFTNDLFLGNDSPGPGYSPSPLILFKNGPTNVNASGGTTFTNLYCSGRGVAFEGNASFNSTGAGVTTFNKPYCQALDNPLLMMGPHTLGATIYVHGFINDTATQPTIANIGSNDLTAHIFGAEDNSVETSGQRPGLVSGNVLAGFECDLCGFYTGENVSLTRSQSDLELSIPVLSATGSSNSPAPSSIAHVSEPFSIEPPYQIFVPLPPPSGAAISGPSSGGSLSVGTWTAEVVGVGFDNGLTKPAAATGTCVTTSGNQTCTISWSADPGAIAYTAYGLEGGGISTLTGCSRVAALTCTATAANGGTFSADNGSGITTMSLLGFFGQQLTLFGPPSGGVSYVSALSGSFTANRAITVPDASGTMCLTTTCGTIGALQVNGTGLASSATVNFENSAATDGLTLTFTNPSAGNVQLGFTGTLSNSGLANPSTTVNGTTCTLGSTCTISGSFANLALSNLSGVALNTSLVPGTVNSIDLGTSPLPFRNMYFGIAANKAAELDASLLTANRDQKVPDEAGTFMMNTDVLACSQLSTILTGDIGNSSCATTVNKIQGTTVTITTPVKNQIVQYNGSALVNAAAQQCDDPETGTSYTIPNTDGGCVVRQTNAGTITDTVPDGTASGFGQGFFFVIYNNNAVGGADLAVNRQTSATFLLGNSSVTTFTLAPQWHAYLYSYDGTNWLVWTSGQPSGYGVVYLKDFASQSGSLGSTTMWTAPANGSYRFSTPIACDASTSTTVVVTLAYTDTSNTSQTLASSSVNCTTPGSASVGSFTTTIRAKASTTISFTTTAVGSTYDISPMLEGPF